MLKAFFKNSLTFSIGHLLTNCLAIFLLPIYTSYLLPSEYGIIDIFIIIAAVINLTIALEISQGISRYYQEAKNDKARREYTSSAFWFTVFVYLLFVSLSFIFRDTFTLWLLEDANKENIFLLAVFSIATNGIFTFVRNQLRWQIQPKNSIISSLVNVVVTASITVYLMVVQELKVESVFIGQVAGNITASLVAIFYARKSYAFTFCTSKFKKMLSYSTPLVLSSVGVFMAIYIDRIAIKDLLGIDELGIYGVAYRFAAVAFLVMVGFQQALSPLIFKYYTEKKTPSDISKIFNIFIIFALFVTAGSILFSKELVVLFVTKAYYSSESLIAILVMAILFSNMYIFAPGIIIAKKTKLHAMINISAAIMNIILNYTLIPVFGLSGAAYATLISAASAFSLHIIFSYRYYPIPYHTKPILLSLLITLISGYGVLKMFDDIEFVSIIVKIIVLFLIFVSTGFFLLEKKYLQKIMLKLMMSRK